MANSITNKQLAFILLMTLTCYSIITISKDVVQVAGSGAWISVLVTSIIYALAVSAIIYLNYLFKGKTLFEYSKVLVTTPGGYIICIFYMLYFMFILVFFVTQFTKLLNNDFFPKTPLWAFPLVGIPVFCFIANKGITNVGRLSEILGIVFMFTAIFVHILMLTQGRINRIIPFFNPGEIGNYIKGFKYSIIPFLGIEVLLTIPLTKKNGQKAIKTGFFTVLLIGLLYILIIESSVMKIGINDIINYNDALIVAIRDTAPPALEFFARLDILYLTIGFSGIFMGISIVINSITELFCRMFPKSKRVIVVSIIGIITYIIFLFIKSVAGYAEFVNIVGTYLGLAASIFIPVILLIIAKIKKVGMNDVG